MIIRDKITAELNYRASVEGETGNIKMCRIILESVNNMVVYNTMVKVKSTVLWLKTDDEQYFHYVKSRVVPFIEKMHAVNDKWMQHNWKEELMALLISADDRITRLSLWPRR